MMERILPIGSVVLLQGAIKKLMIMGIKQKKADEPEQEYDYIGVPYPEGFLRSDMTYLFNQEDINDVVFYGYENPEWQHLIELVEEAYLNKGFVDREAATGTKEE